MELKQESAEAVQQPTNEATGGGETQAGRMIDDTLEGWRGSGEQTARGPSLPRLPQTTTLSQREMLDTLLALRRFHRGDPDPEHKLEQVSAEYLPALLFPFRDPESIRHDYPLYLFAGLKADDDPLFEPLPDLLRRVLGDISVDPEDARILCDNLARVEWHVRASVRGAAAPVHAAEPIRQAIEHTIRDLNLSERSAERMRLSGSRLLDALDADGQLLDLGPFTSLHLFLHAARLRGRARRRGLKAKADQLRAKLQDQLILALGKDPEGRQTSTFLGMIGSIGTKHVDPEALSRIIGPQRGAQPLAPQRKNRIERALGVFEKFLAKPEPIFAHVVYHGQIPVEARIPLVEWISVDEKQSVCDQAAERFDRLATEYAELFGAMRVAELELADSYLPDQHDALLDSFDWEAFSREELLSMPPVLSLESAVRLAGTELIGLSRLLLSGRHVNVLVPVPAAANIGMPPDADPLFGYRLEIGYLGISHREASVSQTSATRPDHLAAAFERALSGTRAALHVVSSAMSEDGGLPKIGSWLYGGAALEGRAHPFFHYNPEAGDSWARRFDFDANPQPDNDWPVYSLPCLDAQGGETKVSLAFTFADFALAEDRYRQHFALVPDGCDSEELVTVDQYLALDEMQTYSKIPFIWAVDESGQLRKLVVTRRLTFACRDRLSYWRQLQELAGVRSEYINRALREERRRLEAQFEQEREQLRAEMQAAIDEVRQGAADDVLGRLAESLLNVDASSLGLAGGVRAPARPGVSRGAAPASDQREDDAAGAEAAVAVVEEDEEDDGPQEPWISSILCTSCNDCLNINPQVFAYNASKQAIIKDPRAGTYEQIVQAAEKCPSRCIHPGTPLNPDEPNLEELKKRARPFN